MRVSAKEALAVGVCLTMITAMIACGGGSSSSSSTSNPAPPPPPAANLTITTVSSSSPMALTPLSISTQNLNQSATLTVQFTNSSGYTFAEQPIRVASDGTVVAAVPLYADPATGQEGPGTVSVALAQGSVTSNAVSLSIQDLPSVSSYGVQPGQISHAFFLYHAMRIARRIGELQAFQNFPGNTVDTTSAQGTLLPLLSSVITARDDIDRVSTNPSLVINGGTLPKGTPIQFDQYSLDLMDRVIGLYLNSEMASALPALKKGGSRAAVPVHSSYKKTVHRRTSLDPLVSIHPLGSQCTGSSTMCGILNAISTATNLTGITQGYSDLFNKQDQSALDPILAVGGGLSAFYGLADNVGLSNEAGPFLGAIVSSVALLQNFGMELGDLAFIMVASHNGTDPSVIAEAEADIQQQGNQAWINTIQAELSLAEIGEYAESVVAQGALQGAEFLTSAYACATSECMGVVENAASQLASEVNSVFSSATQGFVELTGIADISNSQGSFLSSESGIELGPFDTSNEISALADPGGDYDFFVPLQSANTDYTNLTLSAFDPISDQILASELLNLGTLTTDQITQLPTVTGTCNDTDAGGPPDSDDPDCD